MAEYVEVMNQKRRMCNSYALCSMGCPLYDTDFCSKNSGEKTNADFPEVERRTMAWAAEHPEPKYPTWLEWLHDLGLIVQREGTFTEYGPNEVFSAIKKVDILTIKGYQSIPADIAQKLGIEPKKS